MGKLRYWLLWIASAAALCACTPGATGAPNSNTVAGSMVVGESLLRYGQMSSTFGMVGGFNPNVIVVAQGTTIQFHNEDSFNHTASDITGASFPPGNPISSIAQKPHGTDISQAGWSSGVLFPNAFSQPLSTNKVGTFLFGCFYHYPLMRGVIIVQ
jgi:plastocyanin